MDKTFEESIIELEKIVNELESGTMPLEASIKRFEDGVEISKYCNEILDNAEKKITKVIEKDGELVEEPME